MVITTNMLPPFVSVDENGVILVRYKRQILEDGVEIGYTYERTSYEPGADMYDADAKVQAISDAAWSPEVTKAWAQKREVR